MGKIQKHEKEHANFQFHELPNKTVLASSYQYHIKVQKTAAAHPKPSWYGSDDIFMRGGKWENK